MTKVISVTQQKGGAGKTTIAIHLAVAFFQKGNKVGLIDTDPQGSLSHWYEIRKKQFGQDFTGIKFNKETGWRVESIISKMSRECDIIIIDTPPQVETEAKTAIRASDLVVIPIQPSPADSWATKKITDFIEVEGKDYALILNRASSNSKMLKTIASNLKNLTKNIIGNRVAFASCLLTGKSVTETDPSSIASFEIKNLVKEIEIRVMEKQNA